MKQPGVFLLFLDGMLVHFRVTASMKNSGAAHAEKTNYQAKPLFWKVVI